MLGGVAGVTVSVGLLGLLGGVARVTVSVGLLGGVARETHGYLF